MGLTGSFLFLFFFSFFSFFSFFFFLFLSEYICIYEASKLSCIHGDHSKFRKRKKPGEEEGGGVVVKYNDTTSDKTLPL